MLDEGDRVRDYTLKKFLGKGSYGEVWLAEREIELSDEGIPFALKFLTDHVGHGVNSETVRNEVKTWIKAGSHFNIVPVYDGFIHGRFLVIVSEYVDGGSLRDWLVSNNGKAPSLEKAVEMARGILRGLAHLHSRKIIHRDLKPENILLSNGTPKITDFGVSRMVETFSQSTALRHTQGAGSPAYMPPEAFSECNPTPQLDTWSAGVMFYEMLSGGLPFNANSLLAIFSEITNKEPKPLPDAVPKEMQEIVSTSLVKDASGRFPTAEKMSEALDKAWARLQQSEGWLKDTVSDEDWLERERQRRAAEKEAAQRRFEKEDYVGIDPKSNARPMSKGLNTKTAVAAPVTTMVGARRAAPMPAGEPPAQVPVVKGLPVWLSGKRLLIGVGAFAIIFFVAAFAMDMLRTNAPSQNTQQADNSVKTEANTAPNVPTNALDSLNVEFPRGSKPQVNTETGKFTVDLAVTEVPRDIVEEVQRDVRVIIDGQEAEVRPVPRGPRGFLLGASAELRDKIDALKTGGRPQNVELHVIFDYGSSRVEIRKTIELQPFKAGKPIVNIESREKGSIVTRSTRKM